MLRLSFGNFMFFAAHFVVLLGCRSKSDPRRFVHTSLWPVQLLIWAGLLGVTFAMPNHVFVVWGQVLLLHLRLLLLVLSIVAVTFLRAGKPGYTACSLARSLQRPCSALMIIEHAAS